MNCKNCKLPTEDNAAFCGNCGQHIGRAKTPAQLALARTVPNYSIATPAQRSGETKALLSLLLGISGLIGALFMALFGLSLGIAGIVMGTMSRRSAKRSLSTVGMIISGLAVLLGLAVWTSAIKDNSKLTNPMSRADPSTLPVTTVSELTTPCYSLGFIDSLNVSSSSDSCNISAFNGETLASSSNAYKIYTNRSQITDVNSFMATAKTAIENDVQNNLPGATIVSQKVSTFAGSPAYVVNTVDKTSGIALVEAAVFHEVSNGDNIFILVHANQGETADLAILESQWQWK